MLWSALPALAGALALAKPAGATCCSGGVAPYTVVLNWELNTTSNYMENPWAPNTTSSQLRFYIANNPPLQFMQISIRCSDGSPLTDLQIDSNAGGLVGLLAHKETQPTAMATVLLGGGDDESYIPPQPSWDMPLLVALVSTDGELEACTAGVCVEASQTAFAQEYTEMDRNLIVDLQEQCSELPSPPPANSNPCPPKLQDICTDCVTICGTPWDDIIYAADSGGYEESPDNSTCYCVFGRGGADLIYGGGGDDTLYGQSGADVIYGRGGNDVVYGGGGKDTIYGNTGDDKLFGGMGKDTLYGNSGDDALFGNLHRDWLMSAGGVMGGGMAKDTFNRCFHPSADKILNLSEQDIVNELYEYPDNLACWHSSLCTAPSAKPECYWRCPTTDVVFKCPYTSMCVPLKDRDFCLEDHRCGGTPYPAHPPYYWCPNEAPHNFCVAPAEVQGNPYSWCNGVSFPGQQSHPLEDVEEISGFLVIFEQSAQHPSSLGSSELTKIHGDLTISGNDQMLDLGGLDKLEHVGGALNVINNHAMASLAGLSSLTSVQSLAVYSNSVLESLEEMPHLAIEDRLDVVYNSQLTSLSGLGSLTSVTDLVVMGNALLSSLEGLAQLTSVSGWIEIAYNPSLCQHEAQEFVEALNPNQGQPVFVHDNQECNYCVAPADVQNDPDSLCDGVSFPGQTVSPPLLGVEEIKGFLVIHQQTVPHPGALGSTTLAQVHGDFTIEGNDQLLDLDGLGKLEQVGGFLRVEHNHALTSLVGLHSLTSVDHLWVVDNDALQHLEDLEGLSSVQDLAVAENLALTHFGGAWNLTQVPGAFQVGINEQLLDFSGLEKLQHIGGAMFVWDNGAMTSLAGLESLTSAAHLFIYSNDALESLDGLDALSSVEGTVRIYNNPSLCQHEAEAFVEALGPGGPVEVYNNKICLSPPPP